MIDTQGITCPDPYDKGVVYKGPPESYPEFIPNKTNIFSDLAKKELKDIFNEVLDERERKKRMKGPYDDDYSDEWLYRGTY